MIFPAPPIETGLLKVITVLPVNVCPVGMLAPPALNTPVFVTPAVKIRFVGVVTAVLVHVPAVFVTRLAKEVIPPLSLSVKEAPIEDVPVTVKFPVVLMVKGPEVIRFAGRVKLFVPDKVRPPAPATVKLPAPVKAILFIDKLIALVAVIVVPVAIVAFVTLNVPAV